MSDVLVERCRKKTRLWTDILTGMKVVGQMLGRQHGWCTGQSTRLQQLGAGEGGANKREATGAIRMRVMLPYN